MQIFLNAKAMLSPLSIKDSSGLASGKLTRTEAKLLLNSQKRKSSSELGNYHFTWFLALALNCAQTKLCNVSKWALLGMCCDSGTSQRKAEVESQRRRGMLTCHLSPASESSVASPQPLFHLLYGDNTYFMSFF